MADNAFAKILNTMNNIGKNYQTISDIQFGTVTEINRETLEIEKILINDRNVILPSAFFEIGDNCRRRIYEGDKVRLLQFNNYQKYYVAEVLRDDPILCYGTVKTSFPDKLSIEVGDFGVLTEEWFVQGQMASDRAGVGDTVMLISVNKGKQYYIAEVMADDPDMCHAVFKGQDTGQDSDEFIIVDRVGKRPKRYFYYREEEYWDGFEEGDNLLLFSFWKGKKYYIAERWRDE